MKKLHLVNVKVDEFQVCGLFDLKMKSFSVFKVFKSNSLYGNFL